MTKEAALLLDTCAAIWLSEGKPLSDRVAAALKQSRAAGRFIYVSPITAWEIGLLVSRGRLRLTMSPQHWFERLMLVPGVKSADMTANILIASSFLPGALPRDPADRILAATAREHGYVLITRDRPLLDYASQGHMQAMAC
jgi:PIN domain nuclease of toxin-antitoxin system